MARPRNNIMKLPHKTRWYIFKKLNDGCKYDDIRSDPKINDVCSRLKIKIHNRSILAFQKTEEYKFYISESFKNISRTNQYFDKVANYNKINSKNDFIQQWNSVAEHLDFLLIKNREKLLREKDKMQDWATALYPYLDDFVKEFISASTYSSMIIMKAIYNYYGIQEHFTKLDQLHNNILEVVSIIITDLHETVNSPYWDGEPECFDGGFDEYINFELQICSSALFNKFISDAKNNAQVNIQPLLTISPSNPA